MSDREKLVELIANLLRKEFGDNFVFTREYAKYGGYSGYKEHYVYDIAKKIADCITANGVVIREKGEWEEINDMYFDDVIYRCDVCKEDFVTIDGTPADNLWNFCPNCGADMRGKPHEQTH